MATPDSLTIGVVTDLHFGPEARYRGKLRKLTHLAGELARAFVRRMNDEVTPELVVNLGDDIEDESREADLGRATASASRSCDGAAAPARERRRQPRPAST